MIPWLLREPGIPPSHKTIRIKPPRLSAYGRTRTDAVMCDGGIPKGEHNMVDPFRRTSVTIQNEKDKQKAVEDWFFSEDKEAP